MGKADIKQVIRLPPPLDNEKRYGTVTFSRLKYVTGNCNPEYGNWTTVTKSIFELDPPTDLADEKQKQKQARMDEGLREEAPNADWYVEERYRREHEEIELEIPPFRRHETLLFLGGSADRIAKSKKKVIGGAELKRKTGIPRDKVVDLKKSCGDVQHLDQVMSQMLVWKWPRNDLVVTSDVNADYYVYTWHPEWWDAVWPTLNRYYNCYLRWFWENDRSEEALAPILKLCMLEGVPQEKVDAMLKRRPSEEHIAHMRAWRQKCDVMEEEKKRKKIK